MTKVNRQQPAAVLFLHAQTALHPGSGTALGVVDLPVLRERHTQWPTIAASSLKGVLRDACRREVGDDHRADPDSDPDLAAAFGPPTRDADKHAGALSLTDARLLAFPVRSLSGVFAWVTCPAILERLSRDLVLAGMPPLDDIPRPNDSQAACAPGSALLIEGDKMLLEEFEFSRVADVGPTAAWIAERAIVDEPTGARLRNHLAVLNDNDFTHFARHATEVVARIGLDYASKTVKKGALFYQEFLPAETLLYAVVLSQASRREGTSRTADQMLDYLRGAVERLRILQIGGDETTGKGLCALRWHATEGVEQ